jgi:hypothetical protein
MSYLKDREIWLSSVPTGNPPAGYVWVFIQNGVFVVRDSSGVDKIMASTTGTVTNATSASYVEYSNVADKPALISGSSQVSYTGLSDIPAGIVSGSAQIVEYGVFATTGSNQFDGSQAITGSLTVTGQVVAQTLNVQQVTSSIVFSSGSNIFGNDLGNTQQFTGSVSVTGSLTVNGAGTFASSVTTGNQIAINSGFGTSTSAISIYNNTGANASNISRLEFRLNNTFGGNERVAFITATNPNASGNNGGALLFAVSPNGTGTTPTTALTLDSTGAATFSSSVSGTSLRSSGVGAFGFNTANNGEFQIYATAANGMIMAGRGSSTDMVITNKNGSDVFTIPTGTTIANFVGNVGIGTTSVSGTYEKLAVAGGISIKNDNNAKLEIGRYSVGVPNSYIKLGPSSNSLRFTNNTDAADLFIIENGGNVGIGTNSPNVLGFSKALTISSANSGIELNSNTNVAQGYFSGSTNGLAIGGVGANGIRFLTSSSGSATERMRITSGGLVRIGPVTDSDGTLQVRGLSQNTYNSNGYNGTGANIRLLPSSTGGTNITTGISMGVGGAAEAYIGAVQQSNTLADIVFQTFNGSAYGERMRITSGGDVQIGLSANYSPIVLYLGTATNGGTGQGGQALFGGPEASQDTGHESGAASGSNYHRFIYSGAVIGSITQSGVSAVLYNTTSDYRLKEDLQEVKGLEKIQAIKVYNYKWKAEESRMDGVLAHELAEVLPYAVHGEKDGEQMQGVDYSKLVPVLVKAIQELKSENDNLKSRLEVLEQS